MNVPKRLIGRYVEIIWADPNTARGPIETLKKGRIALATWKEYGVVHDITDGVVLIAHSYAMSPGDTEPDEVSRTAVPESLIETVRVFTEDLARASETRDAT